MSELAKREENGVSGESLTQSILLSRFWVLKRSVDVDGADFLVQRQSDELDELRRRAHNIEILGIVQSKYFERSNQVKVQKLYVLDKNQPRKEFFCSLHTHDEEGEHVNYFFSAQDVVNEFEVSSCGQYYWFALTGAREYTKYRNQKNRFILDKIESGMNHAEGSANKVFIRNKLKVFARPTMHFQEVPDFQYKLMIVDEVRVVTAQNMITSCSRLLEARRDIYENLGDFYWGDDYTGCQFLAVSILAHHFDGDLPDDAPVEALRSLLMDMDPDSIYVIKSAMLRELIEKTEQYQNSLEELETKFGIGSENGDVSYYEVISILGTILSLRCKSGIESVVDTVGSNRDIVDALNLAKIFLPGIERNAEPVSKKLAMKLSVERDERTGKVIRILGAFDMHKIH